MKRLARLLRRDRQEVLKGAGEVEQAFLAYLAGLFEQWGIPEDELPGTYSLDKIGTTASGTSLWQACTCGEWWVSAYILDSGDSPEVFVAMSEARDELYLREDVADGLTVDVIADLGYDLEAWGRSLFAAVERAEASSTEEVEKGLHDGDYESDPEPVEKDEAEFTFAKADSSQRYTLGVAYPASDGDWRDSHGDYATADELEKAAWNFMASGQALTAGSGTDHAEGTDLSGTVVESYVWRGPAWTMKRADENGNEVEVTVAKEGDWMLGTIWTEKAWDRIAAGELTGYSIQGLAQIIEASKSQQPS